MKALSRRQRILASLVLAAGAFASVATSQLAWQVEDTAPIPGAILDVAQPSVGFQIDAEATGPFGVLDGAVSVELQVTFPPEAPNPATVLVTLSRLGGDDEPVSFEQTIDPANPWIYISHEAWDACDGTPCTDTFTVWVDRADLDGPPITPIMITGTASIYAGDVGESSAPAGAEVNVTVSQLEDQI